MNRRKIGALIAIGAVLLGGLLWWRYTRHRDSGELVLQGNVDLREVALAFKDGERISEVLAQEGDQVRAGQVLARLDTGRLEARIAQAEAQADAQGQALMRLQNGSRPEEIAQARATVTAASAELENARSQDLRLAEISKSSNGRAVSGRDVDAARAALHVAQARLDSARKALDLIIAGPRAEDLAQGKAQLDAANAELTLLRRQLADAELKSPTAGVIRSRLMEPGDMASPQRPVFSLALTDPKWVRAYVSEIDLGRVRSGMAADVTVDSFPDHALSGWIGYISSVAEFTPRNVQTKELRTSLVYEVRVFVKDPEDVLRLGMPATVRMRVRQAPAPKVASQ